MAPRVLTLRGECGKSEAFYGFVQASAGEQNRVYFRNVSPTVSSKIFRILESEVIALTESYIRHASQVK